MASLIEELINTLSMEVSEYGTLLELSKSKTPIIVEGDVLNLQKITDEEQTLVGKITSLEHKREQVMKDIADVINRDVTTLKLSTLIECLNSQPKERTALAKLHDELQTVVTMLVQINDHNGALIKQSLEMVEFDLNLIQAMRQGPETANYNKGATNAGDVIGGHAGSFDAKQ